MIITPIVVTLQQPLKTPSEFGANFWINFRDPDPAFMNRSGNNVTAILDRIGGKIFNGAGTTLPVYDSSLDGGKGAVTFTTNGYFQSAESGSYWNIWYTRNALYLFMRVHYTAASGSFLYNIQGSNAGHYVVITPDGFNQFRTNFTDHINGSPNPTFSGFRNIQITHHPLGLTTPTNDRLIINLDNGAQIIRPNTATGGSSPVNNVTTAPRIGGYGGHCAEFLTLSSTASAQNLIDAYAWISR